MIIDTCIIGVNDNKDYYESFPIVSRVWREVCNIRVVLIFVGNSIPAALEPYKQDIVLFPPIDGVNDVFVAQAVRLLAPCILEKCRGVIISDIDIIPINKQYFCDYVASIEYDKLVVHRRYAYNTILERIPLCYVSGGYQGWKKVFKCHNMEDIRVTLKAWAKDQEIEGVVGGKGWHLDEHKLFQYVSLHPNKEDIITFDDEETHFDRLDRTYFDRADVNKVKYLKYTDYHMQHPYRKYKTLIDQVVKYLINPITVYSRHPFLRLINKHKIKTVAHVGCKSWSDVLEDAKIFSGARFITIDCNPANIEEIKKKVASIKDVDLKQRLQFIPVGVTSEYHQQRSFSLSHRTFCKLREGTEDQRINIPGVRLLDVCRVENVPQVDLLCINANGHELQVLEGYLDKFENVSYVMVHTVQANLDVEKVKYTDTTSFEELNSWMNLHSFIEGVRYLKSDWEQVVLFVNRKMIPK